MPQKPQCLQSRHVAQATPSPDGWQTLGAMNELMGANGNTAEAIAAELAAEQAAKPAATLSTFAPECVTAGGALPMRRRRGGANLAGFRSMAGGLFGKK